MKNLRGSRLMYNADDPWTATQDLEDLVDILNEAEVPCVRTARSATRARRPTVTHDGSHVANSNTHAGKFGEVYECGLAPLPEELKAEEGIEVALDAMREAYSSDTVREMIEARNKAMHDEASRLGAARREGKAEGLLEAAHKMLAQGMDRQEVLRLLELQPDDVA